MLGKRRHQSVCFIVIIFKVFLSYVLHLLNVLSLFTDLIVIQGLAPAPEFVSYEFLLHDLESLDKPSKSQKAGKHRPDQL